MLPRGVHLAPVAPGIPADPAHPRRACAPRRHTRPRRLRRHGRTPVPRTRPTSLPPAAPRTVQPRGRCSPGVCTSPRLLPASPRIRHTHVGHPPPSAQATPAARANAGFPAPHRRPSSPSRPPPLEVCHRGVDAPPGCAPRAACSEHPPGSGTPASGIRPSSAHPSAQATPRHERTPAQPMSRTPAAPRSVPPRAGCSPGVCTSRCLLRASPGSGTPTSGIRPSSAHPSAQAAPAPRANAGSPHPTDVPAVPAARRPSKCATEG
jgi:hypothetical protein